MPLPGKIVHKGNSPTKESILLLQQFHQSKEKGLDKDKEKEKEGEKTKEKVKIVDNSIIFSNIKEIMAKIE